MIKIFVVEGETVIKGIGMDIIEIQRIQKLVETQPKFVDRILTEKEKERFVSLKKARQIEFLAGRFAAKEAFAKALGTGFGTELSFQDIEIVNDERGKPSIHKPYREGVHLSITHCQSYAAAQVILEG